MKSGLGKTDWKEARLFDPDMHENPYPIYREFRQHDPVHWDDGLQVVSWATPRKRSGRQLMSGFWLFENLLRSDTPTQIRAFPNFRRLHRPPQLRT